MRYVAERKVLYSEKSSHITKEAVIKISEPFITTEKDVSSLLMVLSLAVVLKLMG